MQRKKARKAGGWGSEIKGWDTQKGGGLIIKGGGDHTPLHTVQLETNLFKILDFNNEKRKRKN